MITMKRFFIFGGLCVLGFVLMLGGVVRPGSKHEPIQLPKPEELGRVLPAAPPASNPQARKPETVKTASHPNSPFTPSAQVKKELDRKESIVY